METRIEAPLRKVQGFFHEFPGIAGTVDPRSVRFVRVEQVCPEILEAHPIQNDSSVQKELYFLDDKKQFLKKVPAPYRTVTARTRWERILEWFNGPLGELHIETAWTFYNQLTHGEQKQVRYIVEVHDPFNYADETCRRVSITAFRVPKGYTLNTWYAAIREASVAEIHDEIAVLDRAESGENGPIVIEWSETKLPVSYGLSKFVYTVTLQGHPEITIKGNENKRAAIGYFFLQHGHRLGIRIVKV